MSIKDETVLAGKKQPKVIPVETKTTVSNAQTGKESADEKDAQADVDNPATSTTAPQRSADPQASARSLPSSACTPAPPQQRPHPRRTGGAADGVHWLLWHGGQYVVLEVPIGLRIGRVGRLPMTQ